MRHRGPKARSRLLTSKERRSGGAESIPKISKRKVLHMRLILIGRRCSRSSGHWSRTGFWNLSRYRLTDTRADRDWKGQRQSRLPNRPRRRFIEKDDGQTTMGSPEHAEPSSADLFFDGRLVPAWLCHVYAAGQV